MLDYGKPTQTELSTITAAEAARHLAEGQFPPGSMGPKIEAALRFLADGGELAAITSPGLLAATLNGEARSGTRIELSPAQARVQAPAPAKAPVNASVSTAVDAPVKASVEHGR
jgi:hypothetical protein